jgi:hypothetical protein
MTARERLHKLVDELSEQETDDALRYIASRHEPEAEPEDSVDDWGDLDSQMDHVMTGALHDLDEEERRDGFPPWQP